MWKAESRLAWVNGELLIVFISSAAVATELDFFEVSDAEAESCRETGARYACHFSLMIAVASATFFRPFYQVKLLLKTL